MMVLGVPEAMLESVGAFARAESIPLEIGAADDCTVRVEQSEGRLKGDLSTLYSGGWITCETARAMAESLKISTRDMGKLLNHLNVKIRECGLGCFK